MLSFANSPGSLFNRLGKLGLLVKNVKAFQTTLLTSMTDTTNGVVAQFNGESDIQAQMGSAYIGLLGSPEAACNTAQGIAQITISRMVFRDQPQLNQTLQSNPLLISVQEVIRQMQEQGASVLAMGVTAVPPSYPPAGSFLGAGNGVIVMSTKRPSDGRTLENAFTESLLFTCSQDSFTGSASAGNEGFLITGTGQETDVFAFDWPLGSNATAQLNAINGNSDASNGNLLTNSDFDDWTSNVPDNFTLVAGTAGVDISRESTLVYDSTYALAINGDGVTLPSLTQKFNDSTGTVVNLSALTQYSFNVFIRRDSTLAATGILTVDLIDQNNTVINDANGVPNSFTIDLTSGASTPLTLFYAPRTGVFRTPLVMPSSIFLRMRLTTALTVGRTVYLDKMSFGNMTQIYTGGPYAAIHSGSVPFQTGDFSYVPVVNSRGAGGTLSTFQTLADQLFSLRDNDLLLPSSATPTISDNLIA